MRRGVVIAAAVGLVAALVVAALLFPSMREGFLLAAITSAIVLIVALWLLPHVSKDPKKYGTWSQAVQAIGAMVFGISSLSVAYSVLELRQNAQRDAAVDRDDTRAEAALDRAATLLERLHEFTANQAVELEKDPATAGHREYDCIIYLKYRLTYTPQWVATAHKGTYLLSPYALGKEPDRSDLEALGPDFKKLADQFDKCAGRDELGKEERAQKLKPENIRKRGEKIRRLVSYALDNNEVALFEWPNLPKKSDARKLIDRRVASDLCTSVNYKNDVFDFFVALHHSRDKNDAAAEFSDAFLNQYPHLDEFLQKVCGPIFDWPNLR
jgi:hypothetical protein